MRTYSAFLASLLALLVLVAGCTTPREVAVVSERPAPLPSTEPPPAPAVEPAPAPILDPALVPGRFDKGKMWTFDNPPIDYIEEAYGFRPDSAWFARARLGALRFSTYCSASFVSPKGLVMTNHHCGRESIAEVSQAGEDLILKGFYALSLEEERKVKDLYVDQLLAIEDVTVRVYAAGRTIRDADQKAKALSDKATQIEEDLTGKAKGRDSTLYVQVIDLYNGGQYSAYTFRRYDDVRLVMAPEQQLGYFGGDPDNFTYPRYALDMSFFRVYDEAGTPLQAPHYFRWSTAGSTEGEPVFVVGNPGSTSRLNTFSELEFERDYVLPRQVAALERRAEVLGAYLEANGDATEDEVRNTYFQLTNSLKSSIGQLAGLRNGALMARRKAAEDQLKRDLAAHDSLSALYPNLLRDIDELQQYKEALAPRMGAFSFFGTQLGAPILTRSLYGYYLDTLKRRGVPKADLKDAYDEAYGLKDWPKEVQEKLVALRLREVQEVLGPNDPTVQSLNRMGPVDSLALNLVANTALADSAGFAGLLETGYLSSNDPTVPIIEALAPLYFQFATQQQSLDNQEEILNGHLARVRFALYGTAIPPDASFSLRLADGVVKGYTFNGTQAPAYTTFFGLFNRHYSYPGRSEWSLPDRWLDPPASFEKETPYNLVTTNDITGGNSGSPLLNRNLEVVGLIFDGNIESLPNTYLYTDIAARAVAVDARGILEALDDIYDADRLVLELTTGQLVTTEAEADATRGSE